jgi:hypothetical protein
MRKNVAILLAVAVIIAVAFFTNYHCSKSNILVVENTRYGEKQPDIIIHGTKWWQYPNNVQWVNDPNYDYYVKGDYSPIKSILWNSGFIDTGTGYGR